MTGDSPPIIFELHYHESSTNHANAGIRCEVQQALFATSVNAGPMQEVALSLEAKDVRWWLLGRRAAPPGSCSAREMDACGRRQQVEGRF